MMGAGYQSKRAMAQGRDDWFYRKCLGWELKFTIWPRRCDISNSIIWFKRAYRGTAMLTGPGETIVEQRWHDKNEHLIFKIKGNR
jgi:hypothetical protein